MTLNLSPAAGQVNARPRSTRTGPGTAMVPDAQFTTLRLLVASARAAADWLRPRLASAARNSSGDMPGPTSDPAIAGAGPKQIGRAHV